MNRTEQQWSVDISGTDFPNFKDRNGNTIGNFWYVKDEFLEHSESLLTEGKMFSSIGARQVNNRWLCEGNAVTKKELAYFIQEMRLFYMKSEALSIHSFSSYMEKNIENRHVKKFFQHMKLSWEENLLREALLIGHYSGPVKSNKQLIDALLYSGNFHAQEKYKNRYIGLLKSMDESLLLKCAYNAMHFSYQMTQIRRSIMELKEDNLTILLPVHLRHEWDDECPYEVTK